VVNSDVAADDNARVVMYELESTMKRILSKDKKFMQLLKVVQVILNMDITNSRN